MPRDSGERGVADVPMLPWVIPQVGVGGVLAALSVTSDLTRGHPPGEAMRACLLATELAARAGLEPTAQAHVFWTTLLRYAGCTATSHEMAADLGVNDIEMRSRGDLIDATRPTEALRVIAGLARGTDRLRLLARTPGMGRAMAEGARADCEVGAGLTRLLGLPESVRLAVLDGFERYDGKGAPRGKIGEAIEEPARFAAVAYTAVMFDALDGPKAARETVRRWSARALDPEIAATFSRHAPDLLEVADPDDPWSAVVAAEPGPPVGFRDDAALDAVLAGFGDAADLKSPWFHGHSRGVAALAREAAPFVSADPVLVHRAGLVHDLGRVAVPTRIWERPGRLRPAEWEVVRLHPYDSARILARSPGLEALATVAGRHHERTDRSGYPPGIGPADLDAAACVLAAADVLHALQEPRPYRPAVDLAVAAQILSDLPLDRDAVRAVLEAAGAPRPRRQQLPNGLTERELEVLRLLVVGRTKKQIAETLFLSASTVHTHTVHIYDKCEVSTRAALAMFAMQEGLTGASTVPAHRA